MGDAREGEKNKKGERGGRVTRGKFITSRVLGESFFTFGVLDVVEHREDGSE